MQRQRIKMANAAISVMLENDVRASMITKYGVDASPVPNDAVLNLNEMQACLDKMGKELIDKCGLKVVNFEDMGESREFYPNHGYYRDGDSSVTVNSRLISDDYMYRSNGTVMTKFAQTLWHELGHMLDYRLGLVSMEAEWLSLSGWTQSPVKGSGWQNIEIAEPGTESVRDDWWFDPNAGFTRFYAKRNPWDDFADSFAYYVGGLHEFLPKNKIKYLDEVTK